MSSFYDEFETTVEWGRLCPKLSLCTLRCEYLQSFTTLPNISTLLDGVVWYRIEGSIWFPCGPHALRYNWVKQMLHSGKYPPAQSLLKMLEHSKTMKLNKSAIEVLHSIMQLDSRGESDR